MHGYESYGQAALYCTYQAGGFNKHCIQLLFAL